MDRNIEPGNIEPGNRPELVAGNIEPAAGSIEQAAGSTVLVAGNRRGPLHRRVVD
jgi:hypothetical protein